MRTCASAGSSPRGCSPERRTGRSVRPMSSSSPPVRAPAIERRGDRRKRRPRSHAVGWPRRRPRPCDTRPPAVIEVELDVVFARPDHLDRLAELLRQHGRFGRRSPASTCGRSRRRAASRGTSTSSLVDADRRGHRSCTACGFCVGVHAVDLAVPELGHRRRRLHRRVRQHAACSSVGFERSCRLWRTPRPRCRGCARPCPAAAPRRCSSCLNAPTRSSRARRRSSRPSAACGPAAPPTCCRRSRPRRRAAGT